MWMKIVVSNFKKGEEGGWYLISSPFEEDEGDGVLNGLLIFRNDELMFFVF